jgi:glycosyltransferase involved in cell wall biosynthesis
MGDERPAILRVATRLAVGGPARNALLLSRGLADEYATTLATGTPAPGEGELTDPAVPVVRVPLVRPVSPRLDGRAFAAVRRLLASRRPALVHSHMAKAGTIARVAAPTVRPRPRIVHTFHGHVLDGYFSPAVQAAFRAAERSLARVTDAIVAVSEEVRDELLELRIGRPEQFYVIPVGLDLDALTGVASPSGTLRSTLGLDEATPLVGAVGRLVPIKDHETLLGALTSIPEAHLAVVGDGELRSKLEARARERGLAERVHFTGWVDDMPAVLSDLDVVALTSRNEGTPLSLIEAGAAARPVVATDVGGVRSIVEHGETGMLCEPGAPEQVALRLGELLGSPALRNRLGAAARARVTARFGQDRLLSDMRALYADLLGE